MGMCIQCKKPCEFTRCDDCYWADVERQKRIENIKHAQELKARQSAAAEARRVAKAVSKGRFPVMAAALRKAGAK